MAYIYLQGVSILKTIGDYFTLGHVIQPVEFASAVLRAVEVGKATKTALQLQITIHGDS